jgi:hypothetical protein
MMSEKIMISLNGEDIEATGELLEELLRNQAVIKAEAEARQAEVDKTLADKASATAKLAALGLTADDLKALGL